MLGGYLRKMGDNVLWFAGFEIDLDRSELRAPDGGVLRLRPKTFALLHLFATNANRLLSKQELMSAIWPNVHVGDDSLFQCIREIRTALGDKDRQRVKSVSGRGYLFEADVVSDAADAGLLPTSSAPREFVPVGIPAQPLPPEARARRFPILKRPALVASLIVCFAVGVAVAAPRLLYRFYTQNPPTIAVMPIEARTADGVTATMAANITDQLTDGLSKIGNIRVLAPHPPGNAVINTSAPSARADLIFRGDLQRGPEKWDIQARLIDGNTGAVRWSGSYSVPATNIDEKLQETRLTAGVGYPLALQINSIVHAQLPSADSKVVVEQANAFINSTSRERAAAAQAMLEKGLAAKPEDVDLKAALASQLLRSIMMEWYTPAESEEAENRARSLLESTLKKEPGYIPALQGYCRLLTAVNYFSDSLVACDKALSFDPWDGQVLYQIGLSQLRLGRFEDALVTFERANALDMPQISRWTWPLGAGLTLIELERYEAAIPWLEQSLAITPGTGRTHMLLAVAYQALGRPDDAKKAMAKGLELRPGTNARNVQLAPKNESARFSARTAGILKFMVAAGLPE
jgi:DNA-binding winged helix-turn-helix (wHTH) protein/tetratricopeptide (TPR) repeat protein